MMMTPGILSTACNAWWQVKQLLAEALPGFIGGHDEQQPICACAQCYPYIKMYIFLSNMPGSVISIRKKALRKHKQPLSLGWFGAGVLLDARLELVVFYHLFIWSAKFSSSFV